MKQLIPLQHYGNLYYSLIKWTSISPLDAATCLYIMRTAEHDSKAIDLEDEPPMQTDDDILQFLCDIQSKNEKPYQSLLQFYVAIQKLVDDICEYVIDDLQEMVLGHFKQLLKKIEWLYYDKVGIEIYCPYPAYDCCMGEATAYMPNFAAIFAQKW